jgi:ABC-type glutathione transport system ATPase component
MGAINAEKATPCVYRVIFMMGKAALILTVQDFSLYQNSKRGPEKQSLLRQVDFSMNQGEVVALMGKNGAGKTTFLLSLLNLTPHASFTGNIIFNNQILKKRTAQEWQQIRGDRITYIPQDVFLSLSPLQKIGPSFMELFDVHKKQRDMGWVKFLMEKLHLTPVAEYLNKYPFQLSGGERQRILIIQSLLLKPQLVLADEPVSHLDANNKKAVQALFQYFKSQHNTSFIVVSHEQHFLQQMADKIYCLQNKGFILLDKIRQAGVRKIFAVSPKKRPPLIEAKDLSVYIETSRNFFWKKRRLLIEKATFSCLEGEILGILGESGAGKTTLMLSFFGLFSTSGNLRFHGISPGQCTYLFQSPRRSFNPKLTIQQNFQELFEQKKEKNTLNQVFDTLSLPREWMLKYPEELSGGEIQKVAFVFAFLRVSPLIIMDEPTTGLDLAQKENLVGWLQLMKEQNPKITLIIVSHDIHFLHSLNARILKIQHKKLVRYQD